jgi:hypothetical protein
MKSCVRPRCREISENDIEAIGELLTRGFVRRRREYWLRGLRCQSTRSLPSGVPRYGYLLEIEGRPVGCLLLIYSNKLYGGESSIFCNVSSWYVDPLFRTYAALLTSMAQKRKDVTYFNVTPDVSTWPIIEAQGFLPYCYGLYISVPALSRAGLGGKVEIVTSDTEIIKDLPDTDLAMLKRHAEYGGLSLVCHTAEGPFPFIFLSLPKRFGFIPMPVIQLGYCRSISDYVRYAGTLGRFLLRQGKPAVILDANGPVAGLVGAYTEKRGRKYSKGPLQPRLGDLTDTELVIYGL